MKTKTLGFFGALAVCIIAVNSVSAQVALTISPSVIGNSYQGLITLNITGLTNTEKVTVQEWLDANNNGVIDSGDILFDVFKVTDGGAMLIGGVTNVSVPFDSNPAAGAISTTINFAAPFTLENITGQRLFQVLSPTGNATAILDVTNAATGATLVGTVYSNNVPFPNSVVVALTSSVQNKNYVGAAVADSSGHYSLNLNPGSYVLISAMPGCFADQNLAPLVTLTNGATVTNNLYETNGMVAISGQVYDSANSNAVGGLMMQVQSGSLLALAFTDTNGNYTAMVTPNFWKIKPTKERLGRRAYCVSQSTFQVSTTSGAVTNANMALFKGNSMFYGRITDSAHNPFANTEFDSGDSNNLYNAKSYSLPNGQYAVVSYADGTNIWNANPNSSANLQNYILNNSVNTNIAPGQAIPFDFTALPVTGTISGAVHDNLGNPVVGVSLYAMQFTTTNIYTSVNGTTGTNGSYELGVANGAWQVSFSYGNNDLSHLGLVDLYGPYNVTLPPTNAILNITVYTNGSAVLTSPRFFPPSQFSMNVVGSQGVTYTLQTSTNLAGTNWAPLYTFQLTNNGPFQVSDIYATNRTKFYRLLKN